MRQFVSYLVFGSRKTNDSSGESSNGFLRSEKTCHGWFETSSSAFDISSSFVVEAGSESMRVAVTDFTDLYGASRGAAKERSGKSSAAAVVIFERRITTM